MLRYLKFIDVKNIHKKTAFENTNHFRGTKLIKMTNLLHLMSIDKSRVKLNVKGRVQGIFYRVNAKEMASSLSITGWVRNDADGSVSVVAEGPRDLVMKFIDWCKKGSSMAQVDSVSIDWEEPTGEFTKFEIKS